MYKIPAGIKLICLLGLSAGIFFMNVLFLPAAALVIIFFSLNANIKPWELLAGSKVLLLLCAGIIILKTFDFSSLLIIQTGLKEGLLLSVKMLLSFSCGALLFSTTTMGQIHKSISKTESFFHLEKIKISLQISLMLCFIPVFFEIWETAQTAWLNRAGKNRFKKFIVLIPLVTDRLLEKAACTAQALENRGF